MKLEFVPAGRIVSVHGIRGELRVLPLEGEADFLTGFQTFYLEGKAVAAASCRVHKGMALLKLEGVDALLEQCGDLVVVSNDVFTGGADYAGGTGDYLRLMANAGRELAKRADRVCEVVCGLPQYYKGAAK